MAYYCSRTMQGGPLDGMELTVVIDATHPMVESIHVVKGDVTGMYFPLPHPDQNMMKWQRTVADG